MLPSKIFRHCPRCGARLQVTGGPVLQCNECGFLYYFNPCCAVAGLILNSQGEVLLLRRAKEPAKGRLAVPGGFIDVGETAEEALRRETREEVGLELGELSFQTSQINSYHYREVTYPVLDLFFTARALNPESTRALDGVEDFLWLPPGKVNLDEIAFPSIREAMRQFAIGTPNR